MEQTNYNPDLHVTAGELRYAGFQIPEDIPDCAWIFRSDYAEAMLMSLGNPEVEDIDRDTRTFEISASIQFPPFTWIKAEGSVEV